MIQTDPRANIDEKTITTFKTAIFAPALSAGLIALILFIQDTTVSGFRRAFETAFCAFPLAAVGAIVYIWLAAKFSILGRVIRGTNFLATLIALLIVIPTATVLSFVGIELRALHDALVWIYLEILCSCAVSDAAYANRTRRNQHSVPFLPPN